MDRIERIGGAALLASAAGTIFGMAHHPSSLASGAATQIVHGALILFLMLAAYGFAAFTMVRGPARPAVLAGLLCYAVALFGHLGAATVNGFVVPALTGGGQVDPEVAAFAWQLNQALAKLGVMLNGAAILFWSIELFRGGTKEARAIGLLGMAAAVVPVLLIAGALTMNLHGAMLAYSAQGLWGAALGLHLVRGRARQIAM